MNAMELVTKARHIQEILRCIDMTSDRAKLAKKYTDYENEFLIRVLETAKLQIEKEISDIEHLLEKTEINR
jgi:hypothetical protein